jgi:hypothetical protein
VDGARSLDILWPVLSLVEPKSPAEIPLAIVQSGAVDIGVAALQERVPANVYINGIIDED